jgi:hypothetical protein
VRLFTGYKSLSLFTAFFLLLLPFASYQLFQIHLLETRSLSSKAQNLLLSTRAHLENQGKNFALMRAYRNPDPYYLNHSLETLSFLQEEQKQLEKVVHHPHFPGDTVITERLRKLSEHNKIRFIEGKVQTYKYYTERTETFSEPIEVSTEDVETVLGILEGRNKEYKKGSPLLLFLDFHLKKKTGSSYSVFEMHCKLLKREFYQ